MLSVEKQEGYVSVTATVYGPLGISAFAFANLVRNDWWRPKASWNVFMDTTTSSSGGDASAKPLHAPIQEHQKASEYLASERTFLAWIRTSIAVLSLGFLIAKFGVWLREFSEQLSQKPNTHSYRISLPIGITMMALAGVLALLALWHYHVVNRAIQKGRVRPNRALVTSVAIVMAILSVVVILYLLATTRLPTPVSDI